METLTRQSGRDPPSGSTALQQRDMALPTDHLSMRSAGTATPTTRQNTAYNKQFHHIEQPRRLTPETHHRSDQRTDQTYVADRATPNRSVHEPYDAVASSTISANTTHSTGPASMNSQEKVGNNNIAIGSWRAVNDRLRTPEDQTASDSPIASPASATSPVTGIKRMADGAVKSGTNSLLSSPADAARMHRRAESMSSTGSKAGEVSLLYREV